MTLLIIVGSGVGLFAIVFLWARAEEKRLPPRVKRVENPFQRGLFEERPEHKEVIAVGAHR